MFCDVCPVDQLYVYGGVPPFTKDSTEPSEPFLQLTSLGFVTIDNGEEG